MIATSVSVPAGTGSIIVCQRGARRRYAVPRLFHEQGMLEALYTDTSRYSQLGRTICCLHAPSLMATRTPVGIPASRVFSTDSLLWQRLLGRVYGDLSPIYKKWGLQKADTVYSMNGEEVPFLRWAKAQGATIIMDVFIHPSTHRIIEQEKCRYLPGEKEDVRALDLEDSHTIDKFTLADLLLCPSQWVAEGVRDLFPSGEERTRVVPYGSSLPLTEAINPTPDIGRIFFAGRDPLRKGLHYLAEAASYVRRSGVEIEVYAAGVDENEIQWMQHRDEVRCMGKLPMERMRSEFRKADVFVLPSLSEGQAGVVLEAMACGCPVIITRESGVDLNSSCGVTVPSRNAVALAEAIIDLVGNRGLRNVLAKGALRKACEYSMESWKKRLVDIVKELHQQLENKK